jgi:hypothetical protein
MIEVLTKHLERSISKGCVVAAWISTLDKEEQKLFQQIKESSSSIKIANLFKDLNKDVETPFKLTAFRSHLRGYCTCR